MPAADAFPALGDLLRGPERWSPDVADRLGWSDENTDGLAVIDLAHAAVRLTKGRQRGQRVELRAWQGDVLCEMFRLDSETGRRVYRSFGLWVCRKNGKSLLGAVLALQGLFDEPGAEVYSVAGDRTQAKIVFGEVRAAVELEPELDGVLKCYADAIEYPETGSVYRALSREAGVQEGLNPSRVIFDELHVQKTPELWDVMNEGSGTREQPLVVSISTFGKKYQADGAERIGYRMYQYGREVSRGERTDPAQGFRSYEAAPELSAADTAPDETGDDETDADALPEADYRDPRWWGDGNPGLGDYLQLGDLEHQCRKQSEADFKTKRLGIWTSGAQVWLPDGTMEPLADLARTVEPGTTITVGFDGSTSRDSTALVGCTVDDRPHLFVIAVWEKPTGDTAEVDWRVPVAEVEQAIRDACQTYDVVEIACDVNRWSKTLQDLEAEGLPVVAFSQAPSSMIPACKTFYDLATDRALTWDGDQAMRRHLAACRTRSDERGTRIVKESKNSPAKIDLAVAAVMALQVAVSRPSTPPPATASASSAPAAGGFFDGGGGLSL